MAVRTQRSAFPEAPVAQALEPRPRTYLRTTLIVVALGVLAWGTAPVVGYPEWALRSLIAAIVLALLVMISGHRSALRASLEDRLVEGLAINLGVRSLDRRTVRCRQWSQGWPGTPGKVVIRYAPGAADVDPAWKAKILSVVQARLLSEYEVSRHDQRACKLILAPAAGGDDEAPPAARARAERTVTELLGPTARVVDVEMSDGELRKIAVAHEAGSKLAASGYRARIERVVSTVLPGRWRARWDLEGDQVVFEVRPSFAASIWLPPVEVDESKDILATYDKVEIPYGVDEDGQELSWRPAIDPNLMVVGAPGTGKTVLEHTILAGVARFGWPIWVVDGKAIEFLGFRDWPNVQFVATRVEEQVAVIETAHRVMEHRYQLIVTGQAHESDFEPLMVFLDEFADFRSNLLDWYTTVKVKGDPSKPPVLAKAGSIARKGRSSRVHLLFATQRPDAEYFGGDMRDNFRARISMGRLSPQGAMMMWQDPTTGTTVPRGCRGRATTINDANRPVEIQTYRMLDPRKVHPEASEDAAFLAKVRPTISRHERLVIVPPEELPDLDGESEAIPPTYHDWASTNWDLAKNRSDLAHGQGRSGRQVTQGEARRLASPLAMLGLGGPASVLDGGAAAPAPISQVRQELEVDSTTSAEEILGDGQEIFTGYGPPIDTPAGDVQIGDLLLVDEDSDHWAVVDQEPGEDPADPTSLALCWRDDADNAGVVVIPDDLRVSVRRPIEED